MLAIRTASTFITAALLVGPVFGQKKPDAGEQRRAEQVRKLQEQNQQLNAEKTKLASEKTEIEAKVKASEATVKSANAAASRASRDTSGLRLRLTEQEKQAAALQTALQEAKAEIAAGKQLVEQRSGVVDAQAKTIAQLQASLTQSQSTAVTFEANGKNLTGQLSACALNNRVLVGLVDEVSEQYRTKSCADTRLILEPLMGLRRADIDRIAEEYRAKAGDERFVKDAPKEASK